MQALILVLLPLLWQGTDCQGCYDGWVNFGESCYGFGEDYISWAGASSLCHVFDGVLAEVDSDDENKFLKQHAMNKSYQALWLGGTDVFSEGHWLWSGSRQPMSGLYTDWAPGEPNHLGGASNEDCLQLWANAGYAWNDAPCDRAYPFVCEVKLEAVETGPEIGR